MDDAPSLRESPRAVTEASVVVSPADCYTVQNGWAWAHIFVRHGVRTDERGPCSWAHVSVISDFGEFGHCWTHIGSSSWRAFLVGLDFRYAMQKFMGERFTVPLSSDEAADKARALVVDARRNGLGKAAARTLWDAIEDSRDGGTSQDFLREWDRNSGGLMYRHEMWDARWDQPNPQAVGFWQEIWPHFLNQLQAEDVVSNRKDGSSQQTSTAPSDSKDSSS